MYGTHNFYEECPEANGESKCQMKNVKIKQS